MSSRDKIDKINKIPILNDTHKQSPFPLHQLSIEILRIRQELPYKLNLLRLIHLNIILFKHPRQNQPTLQSRQMLSNAIPLATAKRRELEGMWWVLVILQPPIGIELGWVFVDFGVEVVREELGVDDDAGLHGDLF